MVSFGLLPQRHGLHYNPSGEGRGGFGKLDSVLSGGLASRKLPSSGEPKERGNETHETESRSILQGAGGLGRRHMSEEPNLVRCHTSDNM